MVGSSSLTDSINGASSLMTKTSEYYRKYPKLCFQCLTWLFEMLRKKGGTVHKVLAANKQAKPLGSDRRDEMRCALRAKISQKDYCDKEMKHFHYGKSGVNNGAVIYNGVLMGQ